jgi:hypothetical protein
MVEFDFRGIELSGSVTQNSYLAFSLMYHDLFNDTLMTTNSVEWLDDYELHLPDTMIEA